ncbi:MAG: rhomboid family intramembrane serine protease, partial [Aerococcus viridans]
GIDIWGHIGGIVGGFLITMTLMKGEGHDDRKTQRIGSLAVYLIIAIFILLNQGTVNAIMP